MRHVVSGIALVLVCASAAAPQSPVFEGHRLDEALRLLQQNGLPIVFSSEIVTPSLRVVAEPRATNPRQQLDELLKPHGLRAVAGPGRVILVVRASTPLPHDTAPQQARSAVKRGDASPPAKGAADATTYTDHVTVLGSTERVDPGASETTFGGGALRAANGPLETEGMTAVHSMPRVTAVDDFRSDFSVRGSPYRQIGIVIDGVPTRWLQHTVYGRSDAGSLSMFGGNVLDRATLLAGAYPRRYDDALGAQLDLSLKEGSRDSTRFAASLGGLSVAFDGEGPLGSEGRGSWLAGGRNSYQSWPPRPSSPNLPGFAFADVHGKLVYDVSSTQQVSVTALGGLSTLDVIEEPRVSPLGTGSDQAALLTVAWRSALGPHTVIRQQVFTVDQELDSKLQTGQIAGRSHNNVLGYRGEVLHGLFGGVLEAGGETSRLSGAREGALASPVTASAGVDATWVTDAAYATFARGVRGGISFEVGGRASDSSLVGGRAFAPWVLGTWRFKPGWTINTSAGASRQFPDLDAVLGAAGSSNLATERATHVDVGVEQRLSGGVRWQATLFSRVEHDVLRVPDPTLPLTDGVMSALNPGQYRSSLQGKSRGVELLAAPDNNARLSGWMSYTYAIAQQHDTSTQETFWSDFDRRHALNVAGVYRFENQSTVGLVWRASSGAPIPGYFDVSDGRLVVGERKNEIRLPPYARLDARAQRTLFSEHHPVTVFGEILNVLNRRNEGVATGFIRPVTGEAVGFTQPLVPRRMSIGIQVDFSR